jgi:hypothetical protein
MIAFTLGNDLENNSNVQDVINSYYQDRIRQLVAEFKGNPWGLLIALMNLINNRDEDDGMAVNGYGNNLNVLRKANGLIQQMLGDITSNPPNAVDFFKTMQKLKTLVEQDPALSSVVKQLESDMGIINNQVVPANTQLGWNVSAGYYNFPPGTTIVFNGKTIQVSGETYLPGGYVSIPSSSIPAGGFTFGQIVAMGGSVEVGELMGDWSTTLMSNFENGVTGIQTLLNGASPAIQQEIQNTTQMMQARENFEKQAFSSITNVIQQITRLTSQAGS